jgi:hypothetical protein
MKRSVADQNTINWLRQEIIKLRQDLRECNENRRYYRNRAHWAEEELEYKGEYYSSELSPPNSVEEPQRGEEEEDYSHLTQRPREGDEPMWISEEGEEEDSSYIEPTQPVFTQQSLNDTEYKSNIDYNNLNSNIMENLSCERCGAHSSNVCSNCGVMAYCGKECQVDHWKDEHRDACIGENIEIPQEFLSVYENETNPRHAFLRELQYGDWNDIDAKFSEINESAWDKFKSGAKKLFSRAKSAVQVRSIAGLRSMNEKLSPGGEWYKNPDKLSEIRIAKKAAQNAQMSKFFSRALRQRKGATLLLLQQLFYNIGYTLGKIDS